MALLDRLRRGLTAGAQPRVLRAAATRLRLNDKSAKRRNPQAWQGRAFDFVDSVGPLKFGYGYKANAAARVRLFAAVQVEDDEPPIPVADAVAEVPGLTDSIAELANELLAAVRSPEGGQGQLQTEMSLNLDVPGEFNLVGIDADPSDPTSFEEWHVASVDELRHRGGDRWDLLDGPNDRKGRELDPNRTLIARVWRKHPRFSQMADSAMRGILDDCEELMWLRKGNVALAQARLAQSGILLVSNQIGTIPAGRPSQGIPDPDGQVHPASDPFMQTFEEAAMANLTDDQSASRVVPITVRFDAQTGMEAKEHFAHITLDRPLAEHDRLRLHDLLTAILQGADFPPEIVTGLGESATYANARIITQESYTAHMAPTVGLMADGLATGWVQPALIDAGVPEEVARRVIVAADPTTILTNPDRPKYGLELLKLGKISDEAGRKAVGFSEDDKPGPDDVPADGDGEPAEDSSPDNPNGEGLPSVEPNGDGASVGDRVAAGIAAGIAQGTPALEAVHAEMIRAADGGTLTAATSKGSGGEVQLGPLATGRAPRNPPGYKPIGGLLAAIDRQLMDRLLVACDKAVRQAVNRAGGQLRKAAQGHTELRARIKGLSASDVPAKLGRTRARALVADVDGLISEAMFDDLADSFKTWTSRAQRRAMAAARLDDESWPEDIREQNRDGGWALLVAGLADAATAALFPVRIDTPTLGEVAETGATVTAEPIRQAMSVAGGASASETGPAGGSFVVEVGANFEPVGGVATGEAITGDLSEPIGYRWVHGDPARPFPEHEALDGVEFGSWTDPALVAPADSWPPTMVWYPGDHSGCTCWFEPVYADDADYRFEGGPSETFTPLSGEEQPVPSLDQDRTGMGQFTGGGTPEGAADYIRAHPEETFGHFNNIRGEEYDRVVEETIEQMGRARGNPLDDVTVYRAVPTDSAAINSGDWVTLSESYAEAHGNYILNQHDETRDAWHVLTRQVPANEVHNQGVTLAEWGWFAKGTPAERIRF